ncbi:zinc finger protein [Theobroma cacao]|uniref:DNA-directed RNA polymerase subunit n=2 Tax=Byttnerioideae TaxID=214909 RepID=A0AB32VSB9_THECC|nr:PREDICTED: DNA-directed RNA polymerase III subunit RPC10 [Theobroma cacao]XP_021280847.1 DNA-directed RNA polymerase III subunit RPC10-like [Herrania umbratica]WRX08716.1 zinc finger protein [Theobroma cacao]
MEFCPTCGNMLQFELPHMGRPSRFVCPTCPYVCQLENKVKIKRRQHLVKKEIEPVFNSDDMKIGGAETDATCPAPNCGFGRAYFSQIQIRSADEPATTFYQCLRCEKRWRED